MPILSDLARRGKSRWFLDRIAPDAHILEVGCGSRWVGDYLRRTGRRDYVGVDLVPPADVVGDIREWRRLGLAAASFDVIVAFEVIEHVDLAPACRELLRPGGLLMLTSPVPSRDRILRLLETLGLNQRRTSPHDHLVWFRDIPGFEIAAYRTVSGLAQWGILRKP